MKYANFLLAMHILYWATLPVATLLWILFKYMDEVEDLVPFTGRHRVNAVSSEWVMSVGDATIRGVLADHNYLYMTPGDPRGELVRSAFNRLLVANGLEDKLDWNLILLDVNMPHVYGTPQGEVVVCAGMLPIVHDEAGVAQILSHEIAHIVLGHHVEMYSKQGFYPSILRAVSSTFRSLGFKNESWLWRYSARSLSELSHSYVCESEADELGVKFMANANYNVKNVPPKVDEMYRLAAGRGPYFRVHPAHDSKEQELKKYCDRFLNTEDAKELQGHFRRKTQREQEAEQRAAMDPEAEIDEGDMPGEVAEPLDIESVLRSATSQEIAPGEYSDEDFPVQSGGDES